MSADQGAAGLPVTEIVRLQCVVVKAIEMALDGDAGDGYTFLLRGKGRVKGLRIVAILSISTITVFILAGLFAPGLKYSGWSRW